MTVVIVHGYCIRKRQVVQIVFCSTPALDDHKTSRCRGFCSTSHVPQSVASPAMGHWGTCPASFQQKIFTQFKHTFSSAVHPMAINCPYYLCRKCTKTRLRASVSSKFFWGYKSGPLLKRREGKKKGGLEGMEERE
jgi:hypothetical protein